MGNRAPPWEPSAIHESAHIDGTGRRLDAPECRRARTVRAMMDWSPFEDLDVRAPGLVAGVASRGALNGWASFGSTEPCGPRLTSDSIFYVASIAKQFTAAAVATLVLDGRVDLTDSIRRRLPQLAPPLAASRASSSPLSHRRVAGQQHGRPKAGGPWADARRPTTGCRPALDGSGSPVARSAYWPIGRSNRRRAIVPSRPS